MPFPEPTTRKKSSDGRRIGDPIPVALSLGGNDERTPRLMALALDMLTSPPGPASMDAAPALIEATVSDLYRSRPVSPIPQADFLNAAVVASTALTPEALLASLKMCERMSGRRRTLRWGPRSLDLDLLLYGDAIRELPELSIPHPRLRERRFYLEPLAEIAPGMPVPPGGETVAELLAAAPCADSERIPWRRASRSQPSGDLRPDGPIT